MRNFLIIIAISIITLGCKISYSFRGGEIPGETFSIESFINSPSLSMVNPNLSIVLQDELQERFTNESNLKYTDSKGDAVFQGEITKYAISPVQGTGNETVSLNRLTISVKIIYENEADSSQNFNKPFTSYDDFESTQDFASIEQELMESISEKLVALVYNEALKEW